MTIEQKIQYNKESSKKYGWSPEWLNEIGFTLSLIKSIENFQNQNFLSVDGLVGPNTYRKLYTNHQTTELKINQTIIVNNKNIDHLFIYSDCFYLWRDILLSPEKICCAKTIAPLISAAVETYVAASSRISFKT